MGETEEAPRKRGRPAKPEAEKVVVKRKSEGGGEPAEKRGRGRPKGTKKQKKAAAIAANKGTRGRPKKEAAAAPEEESE